MKLIYRFSLIILVVIAGVALQGCIRTSKKEARFLKDYRAVEGVVQIMTEWAPKGFELEFKNPSHESISVMEQSLHQYMHSSEGWWGDSYYEAVFRPAAAQPGGTNAPVDTAALLKQYFGDLERVGFTSGEVGFSEKTTLNSIKVANKSWSNRDRTLTVFGQIITDKNSGEIIASISYSGTLNYRPR